MHPEPLRLVFWRKPKTRPEPMQDQRGLCDDGVAGFQHRRRKWRMLLALALHESDVALAASLARDVDIVGTCLLERKADKFPTSLNGRPVVELVAHDPRPQPSTGFEYSSSVTYSIHSTCLPSSASCIAI